MARQERTIHDLSPLTRGTSLAAFANTLRDLGAPVDSALRRAKLPLHYDEHLDAWLPYEAMRRFIADLATREGVDDLGVRVAQSSSLSGLDPSLRAAVFASPTMFHALTILPQVASYQVTGLQIWVEANGANLRLCHAHTLGPDCPAYAINESFRTCQIVALARHFLGPQWLPARVITRRFHAPRNALPAVAPFADQGVPVETHPCYGGFDIPIHLVWRPNTLPTASGSGPQEPDISVAGVLQSCLAPYVLDANPTLGLAAEMLGISQRKLQRALAAEHTSFKKVASLARLDCALSELRDPELPLVEIALKIGYADQSAFSRAFHLWMGISPGAYRAWLLAHPDDPDTPWASPPSAPLHS